MSNTSQCFMRSNRMQLMLGHICQNCYFLIKSAAKNCLNEGFKGTYTKANKFIWNISNLNIKC